jgi:transposase
MSNFIVTDRNTDYLLPPSVDDWLEEDHLARFVFEVIDQLDLSNLTRQYAGCGSAAHHPATLLGILVYGYATGVFSSRRLERATYDSVAFRYIAANTHPDHDTLATFRRRFLDELTSLFVQVLEMAREMKLLKLGTVCLDGTKIHANARATARCRTATSRNWKFNSKPKCRNCWHWLSQQIRPTPRMASVCRMRSSAAKTG